jgi:hypothetical protein
MPLAKDVAAVEDHFIELLQHIQGTKEDKQSYFASSGIRVPRTSYEAMWEALVARLDRGEAASRVFELLRAKTTPRVVALLRQAQSGRVAALKASDPVIVDDLFFTNGKLRKVGKLYLKHIQDRGDRLTEAEPTGTRKQQGSKPYEIALSFAGEDRQLVEAVAAELKSRGVRLFYDGFEEVNLWGKDLTAHFADVYRNQADYCAMFVSRHYAEKAWPQFERQHALARALIEKSEYILPIRLDDAPVLGLSPTIAYVDARRLTPAGIAKRLFQKVRGPRA